MGDVVSFDYFPIHDIFEFGFTETQPWSAKFEALGYETVNFIEGMGSIILFIWIGVVYIILVAVMNMLCRGLSCTKKLFSPLKTWYSSLGFMEGVLFETMVCVSVSMRSFALFEYLNTADKFSIGNHVVVLLLLILFFGLITYFTIFRMPKLAAMHVKLKRDQRKEHI